MGAPRRRASPNECPRFALSGFPSRHAFTTATIEARCNSQGRCSCPNSHRSASSVARVSRVSFSRAPETAPHSTTPLPYQGLQDSSRLLWAPLLCVHLKVANETCWGHEAHRRPACPRGPQPYKTHSSELPVRNPPFPSSALTSVELILGLCVHIRRTKAPQSSSRVFSVAKTPCRGPRVSPKSHPAPGL